MSIMLANFGKYAISDCPFISLSGNNFLSTNLSNWSYTFRSAHNTSITITCVTNSLSTIVCSVCWSLIYKAPNINKTANKVFRSHGVRHISLYP